jgi:hypothetical protein
VGEVQLATSTEPELDLAHLNGVGNQNAVVGRISIDF